MLTPAQLTAYDADGFLLVPDLFTPGDLQPVIDEIAGKVDTLAKTLQRDGRLKNLHAAAGFFERLTLIERDCPGASVMFHTNGSLEPALAALWSHPRLLNIMEQLLGPEVAGHPVWNIRSKTPDNPLATVPWHQDTAYLSEGSEKTFQPTAWIPFLNADAINGTLQLLRGGHRSGQVFPHHLERESPTAGSVSKGGSWYLEIDDGKLPDCEIVTVPVPFGSVLLLNQLIPHRSTENRSKNIRWSVDLRYQRPGEPTGMSVVTPSMVMRSKNPSSLINWEQFIGENRADRVAAAAPSDPALAAKAITGPWLDRWARRATVQHI